MARLPIAPVLVLGSVLRAGGERAEAVVELVAETCPASNFSA